MVEKVAQWPLYRIFCIWAKLSFSNHLSGFNYLDQKKRTVFFLKIKNPPHMKDGAWSVTFVWWQSPLLSNLGGFEQAGFCPLLWNFRQKVPHRGSGWLLGVAGLLLCHLSSKTWQFFIFFERSCAKFVIFTLQKMCTIFWIALVLALGFPSLFLKQHHLLWIVQIHFSDTT